jgi:D-glycero-beta-D-manno-heptose-7-phosphate kinase
MEMTEIVRQFPMCRVLVIGDLIADEFVYGEIARVSREAPVMILRHEHTETVPGGAANTAANVADLGGQTQILGVLGRDEAARQLWGSLTAHQVDLQIVSLRDYVTPTKTRILAGSVHSTRQQMIRLDREPNLSLVKWPRLGPKLTQLISRVDAVIVSDYNYGVVNTRLLNVLRRQATKYQVPVIIDSRYHLQECYGFTGATPNQAELEALVGTRLDGLAAILAAGESLRQKLKLQFLLLTRGSEGMVLFEAHKAPQVLPAFGSKEPVDVTGAGDTVIATFALALATQATPRQAAEIANHAAGLVVMKRGTATVSNSELVAALNHKIANLGNC